MIQSMTGYGLHQIVFGACCYTIEMKSVNNRGLNLCIKLPEVLKDRYLDVQNLISPPCIRGKVDFSIHVLSHSDQRNEVNLPRLRGDVVTQYMTDLQALSVGMSQEEAFKIAVKMPHTIEIKKKEVEEMPWDVLQEHIGVCIRAFDEFRTREGAALASDLLERTSTISKLLKDVTIFEAVRVESIRAKILEHLNALSIDYNRDRFEQELLYYIEKIDISEEMTRLAAHISYFEDTLNGETAQGKKLNFILQEMGREINTLGSKANHFGLQKIVIDMKDELEKMKEQVFNVL